MYIHTCWVEAVERFEWTVPRPVITYIHTLGEIASSSESTNYIHAADTWPQIGIIAAPMCIPYHAGGQTPSPERRYKDAMIAT
jgi:hypothetical protein